MAYCGGDLPVGPDHDQVILWLIAITIVSFTIGFGILATPGHLPTPFQNRRQCRLKIRSSGRPTQRSSRLTVRHRERSGSCSGRGTSRPEGGAKDRPADGGNGLIRITRNATGLFRGYERFLRTVAMTETCATKKDWVMFHAPENWANTWDVRLSDEVPIALIINVGAARA